jgi:type IV pilus assembly protein PilM
MHDGQVADAAAVTHAIKELRKQVGLKTTTVALGVANQRVIVRQVDLPWMPPNELRRSLPIQAQDFIPMPVDEAQLDFHLLGETSGDGSGRRARVLLVAASKDMIHSLVDAVRAAGLRPTSVDLASFAVLRSLITADHVGVGSAGAEAVVDIGSSVTNIVVHQGGVPKFVRILLMGGADLTRALADRAGVSADEAERLKRETVLGPIGAGSENPIERLLDSEVQAFASEVRGSLDYYSAQADSARIDQLIVSGGGSQMSGLVERLQAATRLPVERANAFSSLKAPIPGKLGLTDEQLEVAQTVAAVPVGLALGAAA